ncbi:NAD-dependent epimerase/dehydratase family protein [Mesoflavibacter sp. SCSIO 43206]|uniref:NAD-dependent epimerase/dehydratase family protein n=1 Tax=Mesoflavibacter sp. SCSIO 43206 TaxID=2779362 RepID=UPI001CA978DD|nr:NAD-dependent epimerase/dehydratase family protein [Mesoflavibacter sp. SCSIO 43206]UAB76175.1 NAD-dependent epimerase/dehydratase family protein [Mesoflavibacter sp. SCSIO 43206]
MILVTGGTGLVGAHLLFHLLNENQPVRAIYRSEKKFDTVKRIFGYYTNNVDALFDTIEWVKADLNNIPQLTEAFKDVTQVYHCAAFVSFEPDKFNLLQKTNIKGTANIVNFCIDHKVEKLCYVSSIAALGASLNNKAITEDTEWNKEIDNSVYAITKYGAELEVWRGTQEGLNAVIVNPGVIIGPGIWRYGSGSLIKMIYKGLKYYTTGSTGYVDVNDVVKAMIQLLKSDIKNERYILVSENLSFKDFFTKTANYLGVKPPQKEAKPWLLNIAWRLDWLKHKLTKKRRVLSKQTANSAVTTTIYSNNKIKDAIGFEFLPMDKSIKTTTSFFKKDLK